MEVSSLAALFFLGLSGTGHCIGMCGALVFAFPGKTGKLSAHLYYHAGRITTYTVVGIFLASIGLGVAKLASVAGFDYLAAITRIQVLFSLLAGAFLLFFGLGQLGLTRHPGLIAMATPEMIPGYRYLVRSAFKKSNPVLMVLTGLFMGFLPCGLSYAAFSRALTVSQPIEGGALLAGIWRRHAAGIAAGRNRRIRSVPPLSKAFRYFFRHTDDCNGRRPSCRRHHGHHIIPWSGIIFNFVSRASDRH